MTAEPPVPPEPNESRHGPRATPGTAPPPTRLDEAGPPDGAASAQPPDAQPPDASPAELAELLARTRWVLLDFDGPVCHLFAGHPSRAIARRLTALLDAQPGGRRLAAGALSKNPQVILRAVGEGDPEGPAVRLLDAALTEEELTAVDSARPTPHTLDLVRAWHAAGCRFAVTTNNSPRAAARYLDGQGLGGVFGDHYYGRSVPLRLKPDPYCLTEALKALDADPAATTMIGDEPGDVLAAREAGVGFLGFGRRPEKRALLRAAGARLVVSGFGPLTRLVQGGAGRGAN